MKRGVRFRIGMMAIGGLCGPVMAAQQSVALQEAGQTARVNSNTVLETPVTVVIHGATLEGALKLVAAGANVTIQFQREALPRHSKPIDLSVTRARLGDVLDRVLSGTSLRAVPLTPTAINIQPGDDAQPKLEGGVVTGVVRDSATKRTLKNATILVDNATRGVVTDELGRYTLRNVPEGDHRISVRMLGYTRATRTIHVKDGETSTLDVTLAASLNTLDQVVVTGTVVATELKSVTNAITVITAKDIEQRGITQIQQLLHGDVPGVFAENAISSLSPTNETYIFSRGGTSISDDGYYGMKTYVDGVEIVQRSYLSQIDARSIERVEILTGPQASTIYGSNAINGVIQIFTKRGTSANHPQLTLSHNTGWIQNNFTPGKAPFHETSSSVNAVDGRVSYSINGSWDYTGRWAPAKQQTYWSVNGGARIEMGQGVAGEFNYRRSMTVNNSIGSPNNVVEQQVQSGIAAFDVGVGQGSPLVFPETEDKAPSQTVGATLNYSPTSWWSHTLNVGQDQGNLDRTSKPSYKTTGSTCYGASSCYPNNDTLVSLALFLRTGRQVTYNTSLNIPVTTHASLLLTGGADSRNTETYSDWIFSAGALKGTFLDDQVSRDGAHNTGAFVQANLTILDNLVLKYGVRSEWNPGYGREVLPSTSPLYGLAYTIERGEMTAKLRAAYGHSTRPPEYRLAAGEKASGPYAGTDVYGPYYSLLPNPQLAPEYQSGGEFGLDMYLSKWGNVTVTNYNQTVRNLIYQISAADSVQRLDKNPDPYGFCTDYPPLCGYGAYQLEPQYLNVGTIRNQGWEFTGQVNAGALTFHSTYSFMKSRFGGLNSQWARRYPASSYPQLQKGARFSNAPEHTLAYGVSYARGRASMQINGTAVGQVVRYGINPSFTRRLSSELTRATYIYGFRPIKQPYTVADFNGRYRVNSYLEGVMQVANIMDNFRADDSDASSVMGRQTKIGFSLRTH